MARTMSIVLFGECFVQALKQLNSEDQEEMSVWMNWTLLSVRGVGLKLLMALT